MKITKLIGAALATSAIAGSAYAADLPSRIAAPVFVPPPVFTTWTGFYAGVNAGYEFASSTGVTNLGNASFFANPVGAQAEAQSIAQAGTRQLEAQNNGFIGGGQVGYNYQFPATRYVVGLEADIQGITGHGNNGAIIGAPVIGFPAETYIGEASASKQLKYLGTARARIGYLIDPTILAYATGGVAYGQASFHSNEVAFDSVAYPGGPTAFGGFGTSSTKVGYTVGGGVEWMFMKNLSLKGEYLYYDLGSSHASYNVLQTSAGTGAPYASANILSGTRFSGSVVRVGLNYHFNFDPVVPVIAKY